MAGNTRRVPSLNFHSPGQDAKKQSAQHAQCTVQLWPFSSSCTCFITLVPSSLTASHKARRRSTSSTSLACLCLCCSKNEHFPHNTSQSSWPWKKEFIWISIKSWNVGLKNVLVFIYFYDFSMIFQDLDLWIGKGFFPFMCFYDYLWFFYGPFYDFLMICFMIFMIFMICFMILWFMIFMICFMVLWIMIFNDFITAAWAEQKS